MTNYRKNIIICCVLIVLIMFFCSCNVHENKSVKLEKDIKMWVTGYLPSYRQSDAEIPFVKDDDFEMLTHIVHHGSVPKEDGSIDFEYLQMTHAKQKMTVELAHKAGKPILFGLLGHYEIFNKVISNVQIRKNLIDNLLSLITDYGYDGINLDMEPVSAPFSHFGYRGIDIKNHPEYLSKYPINENYIALVKELRNRLNKISTPLLESPLLFAAITWRDYHIFAKKEVYSNLDQINLMTYELSNPETGGITWFDSPLYSGETNFPLHNKPAYSVEMFVNDCLQAGIPRRKLGIGISFDAIVWKGGTGVPVTGGVTSPRETWITPPTHPHQSAQRFTYAEMMSIFYSEENYFWDEEAKVPYLSIDLPGSSGDMFVSFNDQHSIRAKINFVKEKELGGFIIWELSADYLPNKPFGEQRPLRKAIYETIHN